jgi:predicted TIM-barrel fold metal-dependent hydrolase
MISTCQPADPHPRPPRFKVPAGAVDCHAHIFGPFDKFPLSPDRSYAPPAASLESYRALLAKLGVARGVLVQPSVYGFDNRCLIDALIHLGENFRGVAVVAPDCSDEDLDDLHAVRVRGVRINIVFGGGAEIDAAHALAQRIGRLGWHLELLIDVSRMPDFTALMSDLPIPVVVDHMGHVNAAVALRDNGFQALLELVHSEKCWVKLSGSYRVTNQDIVPYTDVTPMARALVEAGPTRCMWATDWPHPSISVPMPNDGDLIDQLTTWIPDLEIRNNVLRDNALHFYGFT